MQWLRFCKEKLIQQVLLSYLGWTEVLAAAFFLKQ